MNHLVKYCRILLWLIFGCISSASFCQNYNRPVPVGMVYPYEFVQFDTVNYGYYLADPYKFNDSPTSPDYIRSKAMLFDKDGYLIWFSANTASGFSNFQYFPQIHQFSYFNQFGIVNPSNCFNLLDSTFQITHYFPSNHNTPIDAHEFQVLSNGNFIYAVRKDTIMDLSIYTFTGGIQGSHTTTVRSYWIQEYNAAHNMVFEWNSAKHIFPTETYNQFGYDSTDFDYAHGNAISEDADGNLLVSFRHLNSIYKINHANGNVMWRLGGKSNTFTLTNDNGFSGQHDVRYHADGSISFFDNANTSTPKHTRALVFSLDTLAHTATRIWQYKPIPTFFSQSMGSHQITADGNHLINYGNSRRPFPSIDFLNASGNKISQWFFPDTVVCYRAFIHHLPFKFPRPAISCSQGINSITLSAPASYQSYVWSTGDTTQSITVSDTGVYQVWVNYGVGMLGSKPYFVADINSACLLSGIKEHPIVPIKTDYTLYDLLGRIISKPKPNQVYIYRDSEGHAELRYYQGE